MDSWRAQTKIRVHQETGERSSVPTRDWDRLACDCQGVSRSTVGPQANKRKGTQLHPSTENWIKDLLSMAPPIRIRSRFPPPPSQSLPSGSFHKPHSYSSEGRQNENHNHRKLTKLITWTTTLSNSMKLWVMPCRVTQDERVVLESSDKMWSTGEGNGKTLQHSCHEQYEQYEQYEKAKR